MAKFIFFDTECNGLPQNYRASVTATHNWPRMIQLAWIVTDENGTILKTQSHIIRPEGFTIIPEVAQLTRITTDRAEREGITLQSALREFMDDLADANLIVGHNISFDLNIVGCELYREGMAYNTLLAKRNVCTMQRSTDFCAIPSNSPYGGYKWPKLEELHRKLFGCTFDGAHDALADIEATKKCYFALKQRGIVEIRSTMNYTPNFITSLKENEIFVFGSNLQGMHGGGAARIAHQKFGAEWGVGVGMTGQCYAIPTMHGGVDAIKPYVDEFVAYAKAHTEWHFLVTRIGCGIAGFTDEEMAPLFEELMGLSHVSLPKAWEDVLKE